MLRLALLGTPEVTLQGHSLLEQLAGRGLALIVYLAVNGQAHPRGRLADLLWHDMSNEEALKRLRNLLPRVRPLLATHIHITRDSLAFDKSSSHWLDVDVLRVQLNPSAGSSDPQVLENFLKLYRADFLADFSLRDAPVFEEWVIQQREELHRLVIQGFHRLADCYLKCGDYQAGLVATQRLLTLQPWREEAHRQQMLLLAKRGERTAALMQFHLCQRVLADEFGIEPTAETVLLYEQLRSNAFKNSEAQAPITLATTQSLQANWDGIPRPLRFYGREAELKTLGQWINQERCRLVGIFGLGGQGKSTLMAHWLRTHCSPRSAADILPGLENQPKAAFAHILWCSLSSPPPLTKLLQEWLFALSGIQSAALPARLEQQLALLLSYLRQQRCLVVLDNLEHVLPPSPMGDPINGLPVDYAALLHGLATGEHQSCLVVISQQRPTTFSRWEEHTPAIRSLHLQGLSETASLQLLSVNGLSGPACLTLARRYAGCPLALLVAAEAIQELFAGNTESFLNIKIWISADLYTQINQQFVALGVAEQTLLLWLALAQTPLTFDALCARLVMSPHKRVYLDACRTLLHRSLIETHTEGFSLPNVLQAYLIDYLVEGISQELIHNRLTQTQGDSLLNRYRLLDPEAPRPIQDRQIQLLLLPILETLRDHWGLANLILHLQTSLETWLRLDPRLVGYAQDNLRFLLQQLKASLLVPQKPPGAWAMTASSFALLSMPGDESSHRTSANGAVASNNIASLPKIG